MFHHCYTVLQKYQANLLQVGFIQKYYSFLVQTTKTENVYVCDFVISMNSQCKLLSYGGIINVSILLKIIAQVIIFHHDAGHFW